MSLSYEESLKMMQLKNTMIENENIYNVDSVSDTNVMSMSLEDAGIITASFTESGWTKVDGKEYRFYNVDYKDNNYSTVDELKNIILDPKQINITQEQNSQYIPFQMPRYYDGFDLTKTKLEIYYVNKNMDSHSDIPVDVYYNDEYIRFAWLVSEFATQVSGILQFEIQARGINEKNETYVWKSKSIDKLNVLQSLQDIAIGEIGLSEEEIKGWYNKIQIESQKAQESAANAQAFADRASVLVASLEDGIADEVKTAVDNTVGGVVDDKITNKLINYYTKSETYNKNEINTKLDSLDITDKLVDYALKTDVSTMIAANPQDFATKQDVTDAIEEQDITSKLGNYYKKTETYNQTEIDDKIANVKVDLTGYATETYVDNKESQLSSAIGTNTENISSLSEIVGSLQEDVNSIDKSPRLTYDVAYNDVDDPDVGENVFVFYEIENEGKEDEVKEAKKKFTIVGGSGGSAGGSTLKIGYITTSPLVVTINDKAIIKYTFSGIDSSGDNVPEGNATWKIGGRIVATNIALNGENSFDVTEYLTVGTQKVNLSITDEGGSLVTKTWTVQKIDVRLESTFNDAITYPIGKISFDYTPYGAISKEIHFVLDGKEIDTVTTASSGIPMAYDLPQQTHGAHLLEVYMTSEINGNNIESNHIVKDIIWYDKTSDTPVIGCVKQNFTAKQYDTTNIVYTVYDPSTETPTVRLSIDGVIKSTLTLDSNTQVWQYKETEVGNHVLTIECGKTVKTLNVTVEELDIDAEPITAGLVFDFNPVGKSNNDVDRVWSDGDVSMLLSDNFDWTNGGYQIDENGDQYFCIKAGTSAVIDYKLFEDDAKRNGKEFKLVFKTSNVKKSNATFLSCIDGSDTSKVGIQMNVHEAYIYASADDLYLPYSEEDIIEFEFNINKNTDDIPMVMGYEDGVATRPLVYTESHSFSQNNPKYITIGSEDCDVLIYRFKVYNTALTNRGVLQNFIADARNAEEMIDRYNRNQIYDENGALTPEILAEKCPDLRIIKIDAPWFTNDKKDKVVGTTIQMIYKNGDPILDNWTAYDSQHSGQGTSSNEYGAAGRNMDLIMNKSGVDGVKPRIVLGDGSEVKKISLTRNSVETNYLNVKVNIASSENQNNALLQRRYNEYNPYVRPAKQNNTKVKDTMEFVNCVVFVRENNPDISTHREFDDCEYHYYALGNVGDSKKTDNTRVNDPDDKLECILEIMDYNLPLSEFPKGQEALDILDADNFDEEGTYGWRYRVESDDSIEDASIVETINEKWREFYRFVVNSTDKEFHDNLKNYFVVDSALFYYLFTERYTMVDNRAKNSFWHYGKCEDGIYRWDLCFDYDNDTSLGIDNVGKLVLPYGKEDTDYYVDGDPSSSYIYRAAESTFFCRVRDLFKKELEQMFVQCESKGAWSASGLINQFDKSQEQFPEELWRIDIERKYIRTYKDGATRFLTEMANGRKKYQRRQFERNQELYMATKYFGTVATSNQIMMRFNNPVGATVPQDFTLYITPYSDMYIAVKFGNVNPTNFRAKAGIEYTIPYGIDADTADITLIYGASFIQAIGDLSRCYVGDNDFSKASRLQKLVIGSDVEGYKNSYITQLKFGNNKLLEYLDIQNTPELKSIIDLSTCNNMKELYAYGSGATGVIFANGGKIETSELPAIGSIVMKNLMYLTNLDISSYNNMHTLTSENCNIVDVKSIVENSKNMNRVRITGIDWALNDTSLLERIYNMYGKDNNGYDTPKSVLSGKVHVPVIKQQQLYDYQKVWSDLEITFDTMIEQYAVTFMNADGNVLEVQYVDKGGNAIDPTTRDENPITPTIPSTISHDFTFSGWDSPLTSVFSERTITATYTQSLRSYTIKYVSKGITMQESTGLYGENIPYNGVNPVYTSEETGYVYYLFNRWDKSGFIDGNKTVNAIFDKFTYTENAFDGKELKDMTPVEIYAMNKLNLADSIISDKDPYSFIVGNDVDYDDIESELLISEKTYFNGTNYIDTGIQLFNEDKDFVLAIDYEFLTGNTNGSVLAQCFQANGSNGFKLWHTNSGGFTGARLTWGTTSDDVAEVNKREILVIRHKKGENNITVYKSNLDGDNVLANELTRTKSTSGASTLVFGCAKADDGMYENNAIGNINWCKIWYEDLGDKVCKDLAMWTHETITLEACGFRKYYLTDNTSKRCSFSLLATHILGRAKAWNPTNTNAGGWANSALNKSLNSRLYNAMPTQIKALLKQVIVYSSVGQMSTELQSSNCYITIPAVIEVDSYMTSEPYANEGIPISYLTTNETRKRAYDGGDYDAYWLRSPNVSYQNYIWRVDKDGVPQGITNATTKLGVLIEISF